MSTSFKLLASSPCGLTCRVDPRVWSAKCRALADPVEPEVPWFWSRLCISALNCRCAVPLGAGDVTSLLAVAAAITRPRVEFLMFAKCALCSKDTELKSSLVHSGILYCLGERAVVSRIRRTR